MEENQLIHPTAVIHPGAKLGVGVEVGPYCVIADEVQIGAGTKLHPHVVIEKYTTIGENCEFFPGVCAGGASQDLKYKGEKAFTEIGDRVVIHEYATVHRACGENEKTTIGNDVLMMAYTHVAHNCIVGNNVIMSNGVTLAGHVVVEDRAVIGGLSAVHQFGKVGRNCMIGGMTRVAQDVPPYIIMGGNPPVVAGLNTVGMTRAGISAEARKELKKAFRLVYRSGLGLQDAIAKMEEELVMGDEVAHFIDFLKHVERGICRTSRSDLKG